MPFESAIIERYKRRKCSVEEALIEMHLDGIVLKRLLADEIKNISVPV